MNSDVFMLHAIGGGDTLWSLFNALASLIRPEGGSLLKAMIFLGTLIGVVSAVSYTVFKNDLKYIGKWYVASQVMMIGLLTPVSTLHLHDHMTGFNRSVDNVPFLLAFMASQFSTIGSEITQLIEATFQPSPHYSGGHSSLVPLDLSQLRYSQTGFMFASHVMVQMKGVQLQNEDMMENLREFVNQCVVYDALIGKKFTIHDLKKSDTLWELVSRRASQMRGFSYRDVSRDVNGHFISSNGTSIITCKQGVERFNQMWGEVSDSLVSHFVRKVRSHLGLSASQQTVLQDHMAIHLPGAFNKLMHTSKEASSHLKQQVMITSILQGNERKTIELGGSANLDVRRAYLQQQTTYQTIGQTIAQTLPSLKTALECLAYALFIFVVFLSMLPRGSRILLFYMKLLVWLQLWPPLFSILNFIMTESMASSMIGALKTAQGITIGNMVGLSNMANDMAATAGYLCTMIPVLSWTLIEQGGYAFVSMASGLLGVSQNAATGAAVEKISGNYNTGNIAIEGYQVDHHSAFKHDFAPSYANGFIATNTGIISSTIGADGETVINRGESHLPVTISAHEARDHLLNEAIHQADSFQHANSEAATSSQRQAYNDYYELGKQASMAKSKGTTYENSETSQLMQEASDHYEKMKQISSHYGFSESQLNDVFFEASGGGGFNIGLAHGKLSSGTNEKSSSSIDKATQDLHQLSQNSRVQDSMNAVQNSSKSGTFHTENQETNQLAQHLSSSLENSKTYETAAHKSREISHSLQQERAHNQSQGTRVDANLTQEFVNTLGADKVKHLSVPEMYQQATHFADNHTKAYQHQLESNLQKAGISSTLEQQYQGHTLAFTTNDVERYHQNEKEKLSSKTPSYEIDEVEKAKATTVLARNNEALHYKQKVLEDDMKKKTEKTQQQSTHHLKYKMGVYHQASGDKKYMKYKEENR